MSRERVLVVDDDLALAETLADGLTEHGFDAVACASSTEAARRLEEEPFDALVTDLRMPAIDGLGLLARSKRAAPDRPVIVMTGYGAIDTAVDAIRHGAHHYMTKPFATDELALFVRRALDEVSVRREARSLRETLRERAGLGTLVAASPAMREVFDVAQRVADAATPVLILGETGTGKTALARAIHAAGARAGRSFVAVNCAALPESRHESELLGHAKGAFAARAGARARAPGSSSRPTAARCCSTRWARCRPRSRRSCSR
jgi:two-component system response regulator HydG